jgi:ComF family protein
MPCRRADEQGIQVSAVDFLFPVFSYRLWCRELVFVWKSRGVRIFTPIFARIILRVLQEELWPKNSEEPIPVIVPVPPRPGKIREKGWDQIEDLCSYLEGRFGVPVARLLVRRSTTQQKKLDQAHRKENAQSAYGLAQKLPPTLPSRVILLDDVRTTGATMDICAQALKARGVQEVQGLVLFSVD